MTRLQQLETELKKYIAWYNRMEDDETFQENYQYFLTVLAEADLLNDWEEWCILTGNA